MNKFSKEQQALLECALDKLYTFLREKYKVEYHSNIRCVVYNDIVHIYQWSYDDNVAWFAFIFLKDKKINIFTRKVEYVYSKFDYEVFYMSSTPIIHHIDF